MNREITIHGGILVYVEFDGSGICPVSLELIGEAARLAKKSKMKVCAMAVGENTGSLRSVLGRYPLEMVYLYENTGEFRADVYEQAVEDCVGRICPSIILVGGTAGGRALAPRVAARFRTGITADCTELDIDACDNLVQTRPAFGGNVMARILTPEKRPQIATVRPGVMKQILPSDKENVKFIEIGFDYVQSGVTVLKKTEEASGDGITNAEIIVAAGRGVKCKEDLSMLRELAQLLGGKLASSRALVEKGWVSSGRQIGLSGQTVSPKCLITFGISGSVQFRAGIKNAETIISVNTDPNAEIFKIAHYPICCDLYDIVPEMIKMIKGNK
jgi:electron transfer flavoprotein alpha subunit